MAIYITARHMVGGTKHEHVSEVKWENHTTKETGKSSRAEMVARIKNKAGDARVAKGQSYVTVKVVEASPPYIRTFADGVWTDNLLAPPTY